jgi:hypothetical protein
MYGTMSKLVVFDNHERSGHNVEREVVQKGMGNGATSLLGCCVRRLEDKNGLGNDEYAAGVEKRMSRK